VWGLWLSAPAVSSAHAFHQVLDGVGRPAPWPAAPGAPELRNQRGSSSACRLLALGLVDVLRLAQLLRKSVCDPVREKVGIAALVTELGDDVLTELRQVRPRW
jgi:hypothetical protein